MFRAIVERLVNDPVRRSCDFLWKAIAVASLDGDAKPRPPRDPFGQEFEGGHKPQIVQDGGTEFVREVPQLLFDLIQKLSNALEAPAALGGELAGNLIQDRKSVV